MYREYTDIKIKEYFGDVLQYESTEIDEKLHVKLKTDSPWDEKSAMAYQIIILYRHPSGYGRPLDFKCEKMEDNTYEIKWNCYNVSD